MFTPQYAENPFHFGQDIGLGFLGGLPIDGAGKGRLAQRRTKAYQAQMVVLPEKQLGVAVLANADSAKTLIYELAEETLRMALLARDGIAPRRRPPRARR